MVDSNPGRADSGRGVQTECSRKCDRGQPTAAARSGSESVCDYHRAGSGISHSDDADCDDGSRRIAVCTYAGVVNGFPFSANNNAKSFAGFVLLALPDTP